MILVLEENEINQQLTEEDSVPVLKMTYMQKKQAIDFLKRILYVEGKNALIRGVDLENHKVIEMWERMNFLDCEAFRISGSLNRRRKLLEIANDMEQRLKMKAIKD